MNEHIRKCCDGAGLDSNWKPGFDSIYGQQLEKFAELIVRECMEVCADRGKHHDGLYSAWASDCSERIGKRFGVE